MAENSLIEISSGLIGYVGLTAIGGIIEGVSGETVLGNYSRLRESLSKYKPDGNHEIQTAVLRSYLQATLQVCIVHGETVGIPVNNCIIRELLPRFLAKAEIITRKIANPNAPQVYFDESITRQSWLNAPSDIKKKVQAFGNKVYAQLVGESPQLETPIITTTDEAQWLRRAIDEYTELLTQLSQSKLNFPDSVANSELNELLGEKGLLMQAKSAKEREDIIREKILKRVETELVNKFGTLPREFRTFFLDNWFNYFCGCFHYQLARNAELARKFQSQLLADIGGDQHQLIASFKKFSGEFGERLKGIEGNIAWLEAKQDQGFDDIKQLLFSMMPLLATVDNENIRKQVVVSLKPEFDELVDRIEDVVRRVLREELQPKTQIPTELLRNLKNLDAVVFGRDIEAETIRKAFCGKNSFAEKRFYIVVAPTGLGKSYCLIKALSEVTDNNRIKPDYAQDVQRIIRIDCEQTKNLSQIVSEFANIIGLDIGYPNDLGFPFAYLNGVLFQYVRSIGKVWLILDNFEDWLDGENKYQPINRDIYAFLEALFKGNHSIRGVFLSQSALRFEADEYFEAIDDVGKMIAKGLPEAEALEMMQTNGKVVGLDSEPEARLKEFLDKTDNIPQAITSLIGFLYSKRFTPNVKLQSVLEDFATFDAHEQKDGETHTKYLISRQIDAQSPSVKLLLQAIAFLDKQVAYEALHLLANDEDISRLVEHNLATIERDLRGSVYYNLHNYFSKQTLAALPKFEDIFDIKLYADDLYNAGYDQNKHHFLTNAINLYECSEKIYEYLELPNDVADSYVGKGVSLRQLGKLNEAIAEYDKAILIRKGLVESGRLELSNDLAMAYMNKGVSLYSLGKLNEAIAEYDKAILILKGLVESGRLELSNDLAKAYMNKGVSLRNLGKLNEAIAEYDKAILIRKGLVESGRLELSNDLAMAYMNKGNALYSLGKLNEAIAEYDKAILIRKGLVNSGRLELSNDLAMAYMNKGNALYSLGKLNEAIAEYDKAILIRKGLVNSGRLELSNDLAKAYMNKGNALDSLSKLNEAIEHYGDAINLWEETLQHGEIQNLPNIAIALGNRLDTHRKAGNDDLAKNDMRRLHELLEFTKQHKEIEHLGEYIQKQIDERS